PIALVGYMQRDLVDQRRWVSRQDYVEGLALAQLAPGPLAAQLAIYLGWVRAGVPGATLVSVAFILPSFLMVLALSALYLRYGGLAWMQGVFYGVGAAVIAIIARSAWKLVHMTLGQDRLLWVLFGVSALVTAWTESEVVWLFVLCGVAALVVRGLGGVPGVVLWARRARPARGGVRRRRDGGGHRGHRGRGLRGRPPGDRRRADGADRARDGRHPGASEANPRAARHPRGWPDWAGAEGRGRALSAMRTVAGGDRLSIYPPETGPRPRDRPRGAPSARGYGVAAEHGRAGADPDE